MPQEFLYGLLGLLAAGLGYVAKFVFVDITKKIDKVDQHDKKLVKFNEQIKGHDKDLKNHETNCQGIQKREVANILDRLTRVDGGNDSSKGLAAEIEKLSKLANHTNLNQELNSLQTNLKQATGSIDELRKSVHDLQLNMSKEYVSQVQYDKDRLATDKKLDEMMNMMRQVLDSNRRSPTGSLDKQ